MIDRRRFVSAVASATLLPRAWARAERVMLYAASGRDLAWYDVDVEQATLVRRGAVSLATPVQYAWPHVSRRVLYVASSTGNAATPSAHHLTALRVDLASGALQLIGAPIVLRARPIHLTTDVASEHVLVAYNDPSGISVHRLGRDGTIGAEVPQPDGIDAGVFAHQVRVLPDGSRAILVARGNNAAAMRAEDPGALKVFLLRAGVLTGEESIAPNGGRGFGPRHLDFHPTRPWVYVAIERQNELAMFARDGDGLGAEPLFRVTTLANARDVRDARANQRAGAIHVHPSGRWVYVANRAAASGANDIAVFAIDARTGEPTLVQHADTRGVEARTFHIDPSGRLLVAAHATTGGLSVLRIDDGGRLTHTRSYDRQTDATSLFWMGMMALSAS